MPNSSQDEQFTIPEATALVKEQKKLQVNDESIRARIYEGLELGIFKRVAYHQSKILLNHMGGL